ncbi:MAG: hypothetical protein Q4G39_10280 [Brachymonas sp.]|nr:hypothetical protein [Brachymonas sp.]
MKRVVAWVLGLAIANACLAEKPLPLKRILSSPQYHQIPIPLHWKNDGARLRPVSAQDMADYDMRGNGMRVGKFIAQFGTPTRYVVRRKEQGNAFLVYDLSDGHEAVLYLPRPLAPDFAAIVIMDKAGKSVRLLK